METKELITFEILEDRQVQILITTIYILSGDELTRKNFRFCLKPNDYETAKLYLSEQWIETLKTIWK